jgi:hypothetical protein
MVEGVGTIGNGLYVCMYVYIYMCVYMYILCIYVHMHVCMYWRSILVQCVPVGTSTSSLQVAYQ